MMHGQRNIKLSNLGGGHTFWHNCTLKETGMTHIGVGTIISNQ